MTSVFLFLAIATFPVYLFPSGMPQISHFFCSIFFMLIYRPGLKEFNNATRPVWKIFQPLFLFVGLTLSVQFIVVLAYGEILDIAYAIFNVFNVVYCLTVYLYLRVGGQSASRVVYFGLISAIAIVMGGLLFGLSSSDYRATSVFNNPNQLGYFALLSTAIVLVLQAKSSIKFGQFLSTAAVLANLYLAAASLSKAAMIGTALTVLFFIPLFKRIQIVVIALAVIGTSPVWIEKVFQSNQYDKVVGRLGSIGQQDDDNLEGRGYLRIYDHSYYLVTGAGEGAFDRFGGGEIHATFPSVFFCYGAIGLVLFGLFHFRCLMLSPWLFFLLYTPIGIYGITHNGIRFSLFWLFFAVYIWIAEKQVTNIAGLVRKPN